MFSIGGATNEYENGWLTVGVNKWMIHSHSGDDIAVYRDPVLYVPGLEGENSLAVDDDNRFLTEDGLPAALPKQGIADEIAPDHALAYIQIMNANSINLTPNKTIDFVANEDVWLTPDVFNNAKDIENSNTF
ncbi:MAG: hypothetical protein ACI8T1_002196 [Verrucomicrobiales bacterium]